MIGGKSMNKQSMITLKLNNTKNCFDIYKLEMGDGNVVKIHDKYWNYFDGLPKEPLIWKSDTYIITLSGEDLKIEFLMISQGDIQELKYPNIFKISFLPNRFKQNKLDILYYSFKYKNEPESLIENMQFPLEYMDNVIDLTYD